jgi:3-oxoacyl-[acyl-carrier-protein] synthase-3
MSLFSISNIKIDAISACVPKHVNKIDEYALFNDYEKKYFIQNTGIVERRFASNDCCTSDLCFTSANSILEKLKIDKNEIDILIFVSQSPDYFLPATSVLLQKRLGLGNHVMAFDVNLGCSGYVYGLSIISNLLSNTGLRKGLLLCGDKSSSSLDYHDKSTYPLFGDAGSATLISFQDKSSPIYFNLQTDGSGEEAIIIREGATRNPGSNSNNIDVKTCSSKGAKYLELNGVDVFNFSLREVKPNIENLLNYAKMTIDDIDFLIMHQANLFMNESVRKKLKFPQEKVPYSISKYGNTSSASIPLTIVSELNNQLIHNKQLLLSGFGVGFSWGSCIFNAKDIQLIELLEIDK